MPGEVLEKGKGPEKSKGRRDSACAMIWCCAAVYMVQSIIHLFSVEHYRDYVLQVLRNCMLKNQSMVATFRHEKLFVFSILTRVTVIHLKNVLKRTVIFNKLFFRYFNGFGTAGDTDIAFK